jgi:hypothetical protein
MEDKTKIETTPFCFYFCFVFHGLLVVSAVFIFLLFSNGYWYILVGVVSIFVFSSIDY